MSMHNKFPKLYLYRELKHGEQLAINQMLISYVREFNCLFNVHMKNDAGTYNLVKLKSINFENEATAVWIHFETITNEKIGIPLDFISHIEISGQKDI
ncbi:hypothetical protein [Acinetobacter guillouiae]|uniref:hypothetical protein n=1 Tax=Acinetobacter guillouiae TaxID=106649 RepID=UPI002FD8D881